MNKFRFYLVILLTSLVSCNSNNPEDPRYLTVCGYVYDKQTGDEIVDALVDIRGVADSYSNYDGSYSIYSVPEGTYRVEVSCMGYKTLSIDMTISADEDPVYWYKDFYLTPRNGNSDDNSYNDDDSNNDDSSVTEEDYSEAEVSTDLSNLDVNLISCYREGDNVELTYTLTNTSSYGNMNITINNVNSFTQKTFISDDLGNQYTTKNVKIALGGKDWGYGNNIEGTLLTDIPSKCVITIKGVDKNAKYMTYYIYTSTALPGSVNYSADVVLKKVKIH